MENKPDNPQVETFDEALKIGDQFSFAVGSGVSHLGADEILGSRVFVVDETTSQASFQDCIFRVCMMRRYSAQNAYQKFAEKLAKRKNLEGGLSDLALEESSTFAGRRSFSGSTTVVGSGSRLTPEEERELADLRSKADQEEKQNEFEQERQQGRTVVTYGMGIQLLHVKSSKYLSCTLETSPVEKENMKCALTEMGSKRSFFIIAPFHKMRSNGEPVRFGDQVKLVSLQNRSEFLHVSQRPGLDGLLEANISLSASRLIVNPFASHVDVTADEKLKAGDVVMVFHKEHEGYLSVPSAENRVRKSEKVLGVQSIFNDAYYCTIHKLEVNLNSRHLLIHYEVHGDNSLGDLQYASGKELRCVSSKRMVPLLSCIWKDKDPSRILSGALVYELGFLQKGEQYSFGYGVGGYKRILLFTVDDQFIQEMKLDSLFNPDHQAQEDSMGHSKLFVHCPSPAMKDSATSSANMWLVEKEISSRGGVIQLNQNMRLKHLTSGQYITVSTSEQGEQALTMTQEADEGSLFEFSPLQKVLDQDISFESLVRIRHAESVDQWINIENTQETNDPSADVFHPVNIGPFSAQDVFSLQKVPKDDVKALNFTLATIPVLKSFLNDCKTLELSDLVINKASCDPFLQTLSDLILFQTIESDETDPMEREGIPVPVRQYFMRECGVLDLLIELLSAFTPEKLKLIAKSPEHRHIKTALRLTYRALKQACKGNGLNVLYVSKELPFLQSQSGYQLRNADTLMEIFHSASLSLLESVPESVIDGLFLSMRDQVYRALSILGTACTSNQVPVPSMQNRIGKALFEIPENKAVLVSLFWNEDQTEVMAKWLDEEPMPISAFSNQKSDKKHGKPGPPKFLEEQIFLFSKLCQGRNSAFVEAVRSLIPLPLLEKCILDPRIHFDLRSHFCKLMISVYVDNHPHTPLRPVDYSRSIATIGSPPVPSSGAQSEHGLKLSPDFLPGLSDFLQTIKNQNSAEVEKNSFVLSAMVLVRSLIHFGFCDKSELQRLKLSVLTVLDSKEDEGGSKKRFKTSENSLLIMNAKNICLEIVNTLFDVTMDDYITDFLQAFAASENGETGKTTSQHFLKTLFSDLDEDCVGLDKRFPELRKSLMDLIQYEHRPLAREALRLLNRCYTRKQDLWEELQKLALLQPDQLALCKVLTAQIDYLHEYLVPNISTVEFRNCLTVFQDIYAVAQDPATSKLYQRLLRNLGMGEIALHVHKVLPNMNSFISICNKIFVLMMTGSRKNQVHLFSHFSTWLSRLAAGTEDNQVLEALFVDNHYLTQEVDISLCVDTFQRLSMTQSKLCHAHLSALRAVVNPDSNPPPRNQIAILKSVMDKFKDIGEQFTKQEWLIRLPDLIESREHYYNAQTSVILYYTALLNLFADCASGKNHTTEYMSQQAFPVSVLSQIITSAGKFPPLQSAAIRLVMEAYVCTERPSAADYNIIESVVAFACGLIDQFATNYQGMLDQMLAKHKELSEDHRKHVSSLNISEIIAGGAPPVVGPPGRKVIQETDEFRRVCEMEKLIFEGSIPLVSQFLEKSFVSQENCGILKELQIVFNSLVHLEQITPRLAHHGIVQKCGSCLILRSVIPESPSTSSAFQGKFGGEGLSVDAKSWRTKASKQFDHFYELIKNESYVQDRFFELGTLIHENSLTRPLITLCGHLPSGGRLSKDIPPEDIELLSQGACVLTQVIQSSGKKQDKGTAEKQSRLTQQNQDDSATAEENLKKRQKMLDEQGATKMALQFIASNNEDLVKEGLILACALMTCEGGNRAVQRSFYNQLQKSSVAVFTSLENQISRAEAEAKEKRSLSKKIRALRDQVESLPDDVKQKEKDRVEKNIKEIEDQSMAKKSCVKEVLKFLQMLCEGHYRDMQDFFCHQPNASKSINIVAQILDLACVLEKYFDANFNAITQAFSTLTEFIQGPCPRTQNQIGVSALFSCADSLLFQKSYKGENQNLVLDLQNKVLITLLSLFEGRHNPHVPARMLQLINLDGLFALVDDALHNQAFGNQCSQMAAHLASSKHPEGANPKPDSDMPKECAAVAKLANTAEEFLSMKEDNDELRKEIQLNGFILLSFLVEEDRNGERMVLDPLNVQTMKNQTSGIKSQLVPVPKMTSLKNALSSKCKIDKKWRKIKAQIGRVEVDREGQLERVFFRIPELCSHLPEKAQREFPYEIDQDEANKIQDFVEKSEVLVLQMFHNKRLSTSPFRHLLAITPSLFTLCQTIAFIINCIVCADLVKPEEWDDEGSLIPINSNSDGKYTVWDSSGTDAAVTALGSIYFGLLVIHIFGYLLRDGLSAMQKRRFEYFEIRKQQQARFQDKSPRWLALWHSPAGERMTTLAAYLRDTFLLFQFLSLVFAGLGIFIDPCFFAFQLFSIFIRSTYAANVIQAVTKNGVSLMFTTLLGIIVMWAFSLIAFVFFNDQMDIDGVGLVCQSAGSCFVHVINFGIRGGGFWEGANFPFDERPERIVFNMAFVIIINIIFLNMIFGIIIDTFGQLREEKAELNESILSKCFICGIEKSRFDRFADGLDAHQQNDHNMWHYLYFHVYLQHDREMSEFTGTEQYVYDLIQRRDFSFYPQNRAMVLELKDDDDLPQPAVD